jgi:hypothetical protein
MSERRAADGPDDSGHQTRRRPAHFKTYVGEAPLLTDQSAGFDAIGADALPRQPCGRPQCTVEAFASWKFMGRPRW